MDSWIWPVVHEPLVQRELVPAGREAVWKARTRCCDTGRHKASEQAIAVQEKPD